MPPPGTLDYALCSLDNWAPADETVIDRFLKIRLDAKQLMVTIFDLCPNVEERHTAVGELLDSVMWAVKSIALHQGDPYAVMPLPADDVNGTYDVDQVQAADDVAFRAEQGMATPMRYVDPELALKIVSHATAIGRDVNGFTDEYLRILARLEDR